MDKKLRIFHGPCPICGIGACLSQWQRNHGFISDCVTFTDHAFNFPGAVVSLQLEKRNPIIRPIIKLHFFIKCIRKYDLFHFYFGRTILPLGIDLPILRLFRKKLVMTLCGSEIRLSYVERKRNPYHNYIKEGRNRPIFDPVKIVQFKWQGLWIHKFTAIRNLHVHALAVIPKGKVVKNPWLNNITSSLTLKEQSSFSADESNRLKILHAPSNPKVKGTEYVRQAIEQLREEKFDFDYLEVTGRPHAEVLQLIRHSDIVIDQLLVGGIGSLALESMALGKVCVSYIIPEVRNQEMPDCPVYQASIADLKDKLKQLIEDPEERIKRGQEGVVFCRKHMDYDYINSETLKIYYST